MEMVQMNKLSNKEIIENLENYERFCAISAKFFVELAESQTDLELQEKYYNESSRFLNKTEELYGLLTSKKNVPVSKEKIIEYHKDRLNYGLGNVFRN